MPLLDHYHPPLSRTHPWRAFHGAWALAMARQLNQGVLPPGYHALPFLDRDGPVEVDVAVLGVVEVPVDLRAGGFGAWDPGEPALTVEVEWPTIDEVRVEVFSDEGDPRLAGAVEILSPRNKKDQPRSREAFVAKCAGHLHRGCGLVMVDTVTTRRADLHADLLNSVGAEAPHATTPLALSAVSYRSVGRDEGGRLLAWPFPLEVGRPLPTVPLWLGAGLVVPLDLEASHAAACSDLQIQIGADHS